MYGLLYVFVPIFRIFPPTMAPPTHVLLKDSVYVPFAEEAKKLLVFKVVFAAPWNVNVPVLTSSFVITAFDGSPDTLMETELESPVCPTFNATLIFPDAVTFLLPDAANTLVDVANVITTTKPFRLM